MTEDVTIQEATTDELLKKLVDIAEKQAKFLDLINGKLTFFVIIAVLGIIGSILATCGALF